MLHIYHRSIQKVWSVKVSVRVDEQLYKNNNDVQTKNLHANKVFLPHSLQLHVSVCPALYTHSHTHDPTHMYTGFFKLCLSSSAAGDYHLLTWAQVKRGSADFQWRRNWVKSLQEKKTNNHGLIIKCKWMLCVYAWAIQGDWVWLSFFIVLNWLSGKT